MEKPFIAAHELFSLRHTELPGNPRVSLTDDPQEVYDFIEGHLITPDLDRMAPHMWLLATHSGANVSPLHYQKIKGRNIILTEDPRLHLLWIDERIFVKPLPLYLLSYEFWDRYLISDSTFEKSHAGTLEDEAKTAIAKAALGLLRSYLFLIQYSSDLELAHQHRLLPAEVTFEQFCLFSSRFSKISDANVTPRYHYGELRLTRLNIWCKVLLWRWSYQTVHRQYAGYFQRFYGPVLFFFAFFSVVLSALQVEIAAESLFSQDPRTPQWPRFWEFSRVFSVLSLVVVSIPTLAMLLLFLGKPLMELRYALTH